MPDAVPPGGGLAAILAEQSALRIEEHDPPVVDDVGALVHDSDAQELRQLTRLLIISTQQMPVRGKSARRLETAQLFGRVVRGSSVTSTKAAGRPWRRKV